MEIDTGTPELLCSIEDRVAVVTLNKPKKKNALGDIITPALRRVLLVLEADERVGCVMITGAGNAFCAGGDVSEMGPGSGRTPLSDEERIAELLEKQETLTLRIHELGKITIAALPGVAAGAGLSIALACDLRIACESAFVTTAFKNVGLPGDYGASWFLPRLIGLANAKQLFYTAERVPADRCLELGLFNRVFPDASFRNEAFAFARELANGPSVAYARMKQHLNAGVNQGLRETLAMEAEHMIASTHSREAREAIAAFIEKRPPKFY